MRPFQLVVDCTIGYSDSMIDVSSGGVPAAAPAPTTSRVSSREYLEELRQRRVARQAPEPTMEPTVPPQEDLSWQTPEPAAPITYSQEFAPPQSAPSQQPPQEAPTPASAPPNTQALPTQQRPQPEELVWEWKAPNRPFKQRNKQFFMTIGIIVVLISLILFFAGQFLPIAVVISVAFLGYVLSSVPPEIAHYKFTTYGVRIDEQLYYWDEMGRFWLDSRYGQQMVHLELGRFPFRLTLMLGDQTEETMKMILSEVLLEERPPSSSFDRAADWLQKKIPLDTE
jgi:hypothetical protein